MLVVLFSCQQNQPPDCSISSPKKDLVFTQGEVISNVSIAGYVQKGPYLNGTAILITELDSNLNQTGKNFTTQISDNTGRFHMSTQALESDILEIRADGFYFDEIIRETSAAQLTLYALAEIQDSISVNINILTHLEKSLIEYLINTSLSFSELKRIACEYQFRYP